MKNVFHFAKLAIIPIAMLAFLLFQSLQSMGTDHKLQAAEVRVDNFTFGPDTLTVPEDSTVTWLNKDDVPHTVTSPKKPRELNSGTMDTDAKYSHVFDQPGTYSYFCTVHPHMTGEITVTPSK